MSDLVINSVTHRYPEIRVLVIEVTFVTVKIWLSSELGYAQTGAQIELRFNSFL